MKHSLKQWAALPIALLLVAGPGAASAELFVKAAAADKSWAGTWKDSAGGVVALTEAEGVLTLYGTDAQSIYRCTCVIDPKAANTANCVGDGYNHHFGFAFTYRNRMVLDGNDLSESWEAQSRRDNVSGKELFKRVLRPTAAPER